MKLMKAIATFICAVAILCVVVVLIFLALLCNSCGFLNSGSTIHGPSIWHNLSVGNASYVVVDVSCHTLGQNEINIMRSDSNNITLEAVHGSMILTRAWEERYDDALSVGISSTYGSDMYYGGARLNVYLPEGPAYDIKVDTLRCTIRVSSFSGTNLVVIDKYCGDLTIDGGSYDYVYVDVEGNINGTVCANRSTLKSSKGQVSLVVMKLPSTS